VTLHPLVRDVARVYLDAVDTDAPGLIEGLYLVGSIALGDFRPRTSDIDYVAVTAKRPDLAQIGALARAHARVRRRWSRPFFDGTYVTWEDLPLEPNRARDLPRSLNGRFQGSGGGADPVMWHTLARYGIACRGPAPPELTIATDSGVLTAWTLDNLDRYWRPLLDDAAGFDVWRLASLTPYGAVWIVLGVTRLHYTLDGGDISSKERAGEYALRVFPDPWHRVIEESLRIRRADDGTPDLGGALRGLMEFVPIRSPQAGGPLYRTPFERRRDVLAFGRMVIADAHQRYGCA